MRFEMPRTFLLRRQRAAGLMRARGLRFEALEDRQLLTASGGSAADAALVAPIVDLNGPAPGLDFAVDRANANGLVALVSHDLLVSASASPYLSSATITIANSMSGDLLGVLTHDTNIVANFSNGTLQLSGTDAVAHYEQVLRTARFNSTATRAVGSTVDVTFTVNDGTSDSLIAHSTVTTIAAGTATVAARHIFYNDSSFDGHDLAANADDDRAIATDKQVLPFDTFGETWNVSDYTGGINGVMIDIAGPHGAISAEDFIFQVGNNDQPDTWNNAPSPIQVITRPGAGQGGADRVELVWADGAIRDEWLEVVVAANRDTGLAKPDTFYFGNSVGKITDSPINARVTPVDLAAVLERLQQGSTPAAIDEPMDVNRDGRISPADAAVVLDRLRTTPPLVQFIYVASIPPSNINSTTSTLIAEFLPLHAGYTFDFDGTNYTSRPELDVDLNGSTEGIDFAVDRTNGAGPISLSRNLVVNDLLGSQLSGATIKLSNPLPGDVLEVDTLDTGISAGYSDGTLWLQGDDTLANYQRVLRTVKLDSISIRPSGSTVDVSFDVGANGYVSTITAHSVVTTIAPGTATVVGRHVFYNDSAFDGNDPAANAADDGAIAPDKTMLPFDESTTVANYTNYSRGLNGIMIDVAGPHGAITADDFTFRVGTNSSPDTWDQAPDPTSVIVRPGAGAGGSDRIELVWPDGAIRNELLQVVVAANRHTGLATPDTFYFGNVVGRTIDAPIATAITPQDLSPILARLQLGITAAQIDDPLDINRDGVVSTADLLAAQQFVSQQQAVVTGTGYHVNIGLHSIAATNYVQTMDTITLSGTVLASLKAKSSLPDFLT